MTRGRRDLLLVTGALAVRIAHLAAIRRGPLLEYLLIDSAFYDRVGRVLAEGGGFPPGPFFMNVLYGTFLGGVYAIFGAGAGGREAALLLQSLLGAASAGLTARLGDALGRPREGLLAAALLALFGPAIFYDGALLTPSLLLFLTTAALLVAVRDGDPSSRRSLGLGVLTGLLVLGRANNLLLLAVFTARHLARGRSGVRPALLLLVGAALVVAPVTVRNWRVSGEFVPVTANAGMALWAGNHPGATGIYSQPAFLTNPVPESEAEEYRAEASRRAGRELTLAESSRHWIGRTTERWRNEPGAAIRLGMRKLRIYFHATESQTNLSYYFAMDQSPVLALFRIHLGWVLPLVLVGLAASGRRLALPAAAVGVSLLTCLVFYVSSEYRHPVLPCLLLFAAAGFFHLRDRLRSSGRGGANLAIAAGILLLFVATNYRDPFLARLQSRRVDYLNFGTLASTAGRLDEAEAFLRESVAIDPEWASNRRALADVLRRRGDLAGAAEQSRWADHLEGIPPDTTGVGLETANRLFEEKRYREAQVIFLEMAVDRRGPVAPSLNNAGLCAMNRGRGDEADSLFLAAIAEDSTYASPVIHRGRLALARGDSTAAAARAREALALAPADERARRLLIRATGDRRRSRGW
jgi:Tfp pilus assembly protein PilF